MRALAPRGTTAISTPAAAPLTFSTTPPSSSSSNSPPITQFQNGIKVVRFQHQGKMPTSAAAINPRLINLINQSKRILVASGVFAPDSSQGHLGRCAEVLAWDTRQAEKFGVSCKREWKYGTGRESGERECAHHLHELDVFKHGVLRLLRARDFQTNKQTIKQNHLVSNRFLPSKPSD